MRNIITELSGMPPLSGDSEAYMVYTARQEGEGRINSGPELYIVDKNDAHASIREKILEDSQIVDYYIRPMSGELYREVRHASAMQRLLGSHATYLSAKYSSEEN